MKKLALSLVLLLSGTAAFAAFDPNYAFTQFMSHFPEQTGCAVVGRELAGQVAEKITNKQTLVTVKGVNVLTVEDVAQVALDVTTEGVKAYKGDGIKGKELAERAVKTYLREKATQITLTAGQEAAERAGLQLPSFLDPKLVSLFVKNMVRHGFEQVATHIKIKATTSTSQASK